MVFKKNIAKLSNIEFPLERIVNAGFRSYNPKWRFDSKAKTDTIYYVISGKMEFEADGRENIADANSLFYMAKSEKRIFSNPSNSEKCLIYFVTFDLKDEMLFESLGVERIIKDEDMSLQKLMRDINKTHLSEGPAYKVREFSLFSMLIYQIITHKINTDSSYETDMKINKAVEYIRKNHYKKVSVEDLCKITGYSTSHLRRLFCATYGISPQEYLINYRIQKAQEMLLEESGRNISEIAESLGICNSAYFCKIFKAKTGISPHKYKMSIGKSSCI